MFRAPFSVGVPLRFCSGEDAWNHLKLTENEEEVVICEEDESDERLEQISLCLWGKPLTENYFNVGAMKTVLKMYGN